MLHCKPEPPDPRWHWRNLRSFGVSFHLNLWPWAFQFGREEDCYGGRRWFAFGPAGISIDYSIGNCSSESRIIAATGLSECEAWDRACRYEGRAP